MSSASSTTTVQHSVVVDAPIDEAFRVFTEDFGRFKPPEHNLLGVEIAETVFEPRVGGHLYDRGVDGSGGDRVSGIERRGQVDAHGALLDPRVLERGGRLPGRDRRRARAHGVAGLSGRAAGAEVSAGRGRLAAAGRLVGRPARQGTARRGERPWPRPPPAAWGHH